MPKKPRIACIFVHAGAGYHSIVNEPLHLAAVNDAAESAMAIMKSGGSAIDAVEIAIKILEDREITNAGYGSNLSIDGTVECDAVILDHMGRSGAVGAVEQIKNPISLARLVLDRSIQPLSLKRLPPNFLAGYGAREFAYENGMSFLPHDYLISPVAKARWRSWRNDLYKEERTHPETTRTGYVGPRPLHYYPPAQREALSSRQNHMKEMLDSVWSEPQPDSHPPIGYDEFNPCFTTEYAYRLSSSSPSRSFSQPPEVAIDPFGPPGIEGMIGHPFLDNTRSVTSGNSSRQFPHPCEVGREVSDRLSNLDMDEFPKSETMSTSRIDTREYTATPSSTFMTLDGSQTMDPIPTGLSSSKSSTSVPEDFISDTVGAIAFDLHGHIACGASSGGVAMKHSGRIGPAALVGAGAALIPATPSDEEETVVAAVTSGTGEHISRTMAANGCSERVLEGRRKLPNGTFEECSEDEAIDAFIRKDFLAHPSISGSPVVPSIGILVAKRTTTGIQLYYGHTTDSFAITSLCSNQTKPRHTMSRKPPTSVVARGGQAIRTQ